MIERDIKQLFLARIEERHEIARKVSWEGRVGAPDWVVFSNRMPQTIWVELKAPGKQPTAVQAGEHKVMRAHGQHVITIRTEQELNIAFPKPDRRDRSGRRQT